MNIWSTRQISSTWLENNLKNEAEVIQAGFMFLKECIEIFSDLGNTESETTKGQFCRVCAVTLSKSSHLLLGCYSLTLDALAQEAGALLRPIIETYELLVYFRLDQKRVEEVINDNLPSAGKIAQKISGDFKDLREHLNVNASHFSYKYTSVRHLIDKWPEISIFPSHSLDVFRTNLSTLNAFQVFIVFEAVNCLAVVDYDNNVIADKFEMWRDKSASLFSTIGEA